MAFLVYTSGTTGLPKGAMNTHRNVSYNAEVYRDWISLRDGVGVLGLAPLFHITGIIAHIGVAFSARASLVLHYRFEPSLVLDMIRERRPTFTGGAITAFNALMNAPGVSAEDFASFDHNGDGHVDAYEECDNGASNNMGGYGQCNPDCTEALRELRLLGKGR